MKLVWLDVNASHAHSSLSLPLLHNVSRAVSGIDWGVVRATTHADPAAVTAELADHQPDIVGATLYLFNRRYVLNILARLHALLPQCVILVGGPECLGDNEGLLRNFPLLSVAVRGEGEAVFPSLLERIRDGISPAGLTGVAWRDSAGALHDCGTRAVVEDWPSPTHPCQSPFFEIDKPFVQLETSRGCARACAFCTSCGQRPVRVKPLDQVREELTLLAQRGVREIRILDRTFNLDADRASELLDLFLDGFPHIQFHLEIHPEILAESLRTRLLHAPHGALHVEAGLQTTCVDALRRVKRAASADQALEGIAFLTSCNTFETHVDLLAGLPEQSLDDVMTDVDTLVRLGPAEIQLEIVKVLPGTPLRTYAAEWGITFSPEPPYDVLRTTAMNVGDVRRVMLLSRLLDLFYNAPKLHALTRRIIRNKAQRLPRLLDDAAADGMLEQPPSLSRRFRFLQNWMAKHATECLDFGRLAWIEAGLSPDDPLAEATPWKQPIPDDLQWSAGSPDDAKSSKARIWTLNITSRTYWVIYDRRRSQHQPVAVAYKETAAEQPSKPN